MKLLIFSFFVFLVNQLRGILCLGRLLFRTCDVAMARWFVNLTCLLVKSQFLLKETCCIIEKSNHSWLWRQLLKSYCLWWQQVILKKETDAPLTNEKLCDSSWWDRFGCDVWYFLWVKQLPESIYWPVRVQCYIVRRYELAKRLSPKFLGHSFIRRNPTVPIFFDKRYETDIKHNPFT